MNLPERLSMQNIPNGVGCKY